MKYLNKIRYFRWIILNLFNYFIKFTPRSKYYKQTAYFDLHKNIFHRYIMNLMLMLEDQGYRISIRMRPSFLGNWHTSLLIRYVPNMRFHLVARAQDKDLGFSDTENQIRGIHLDPDIFGPYQRPGTFKVPMPMVDSIYSKELHHWIPDLTGLKPERRIFFVGNISHEYTLHADVIERHFKCFSRTHLLDLINRHFEERIHRPVSIEELAKPGNRDIILIDRKRFNIPHESLRPTLAKFDLFLAPSGVIMPLCHNLTEAMSVGCIPILQHGHLLDPPLIHGHNCLSFRTEDELVTVLDSVPYMDDLTIMTMRRNVLNYYLEHLTPEAVVSAILRSTNGKGKIMLNAEHHSVRLALGHEDTAMQNAGSLNTDHL
jgi:hypothetical protein